MTILGQLREGDRISIFNVIKPIAGARARAPWTLSAGRALARYKGPPIRAPDAGAKKEKEKKINTLPTISSAWCLLEREKKNPGLNCSVVVNLARHDPFVSVQLNAEFL